MTPQPPSESDLKREAEKCGQCKYIEPDEKTKYGRIILCNKHSLRPKDQLPSDLEPEVKVSDTSESLEQPWQGPKRINAESGIPGALPITTKVGAVDPNKLQKFIELAFDIGRLSSSTVLAQIRDGLEDGRFALKPEASQETKYSALKGYIKGLDESQHISDADIVYLIREKIKELGGAE